MKFVVFCACLVMSAFASDAFAGEGKIRQADQNLVINGNVNRPLLFTVVGQPNDIVAVHYRNGRLFQAVTIAQLLRSPLSQGSYEGSGGDIAVRVCITSAQADFNQGTVSICRGAGIVDRDRIVLR